MNIVRFNVNPVESAGIIEGTSPEFKWDRAYFASNNIVSIDGLSQSFNDRSI